jgi:hypothetical protein
MDRLGVEHLEPICTTSNGPHDQAGFGLLVLACWFWPAGSGPLVLARWF